MRDRFFHLIC